MTSRSTSAIVIFTLSIAAQAADPQIQDPQNKAGGTIAAAAAQPNPAKPKVTGVLSKVLSYVPPAKASRSDPTLISPAEIQRGLIPLRLKFQLAPGAPPSDATRSTMSPAALQFFGSSRAFSVKMDDQALHRIDADVAVITIEVDRPEIVGPEMPFRPFNRDARISHLVPELIATHGALDGQGVRAAVIDGGAVRRSHVEFRTVEGDPGSSRVEVTTASPLSNHSTHVAGTLGSRGKKPQTLGMAPALTIVSTDFDNDLAKLAKLAPSVQVSNHSYGPLAGWASEQTSGGRRWYWWGDKVVHKTEDVKFGKYTTDEAELDRILFENPHLLTFIAAGNDRSDGPPQQPISHYDVMSEGGTLRWVLSADTHLDDGWDHGGYDTITGLGLAKNAICIGSIDDVTSSSPIRTVSYSAWGPADDGRIKPDLVANGQTLYSLSAAGDEAYEESSGTSMASPTAAGIATLLVQLYRKTRAIEGRGPSASEIKAVMIHTAVDAGAPGPDAVYGWGSIDALAAGTVLARVADHTVAVESVAADATFSRDFTASGDPIRVTVVWTDPPAPPNQKGLDDGTRVLQNDLDLVVIGPTGTKFFPYTLSRAQAAVPATSSGPNRRDNVEVVDATSEPGTWKVEVSGARLRPGESQKLAVVTSGLR